MFVVFLDRLTRAQEAWSELRLTREVQSSHTQRVFIQENILRS